MALCYESPAFFRRYLAEFQSADERKTSASDALDAYQSASELANQDLPPTHPIRLGLALNFSVFYYEILNSPERACNLAKAVSWQKQFPESVVSGLDRMPPPPKINIGLSLFHSKT